MVTILFARRDSVYKTFADVDVWDADRDATKWPGGTPVIAHPPCRAWGRLRHFAKAPAGEKELAVWAVECARKWGGVLEHPAASLLWREAGLPAPGENDSSGGWTLPITQHWWGHRAEKATWLYIVGVLPRNIPPIPLRLDEPTHVIQSRKKNGRPHVTRAEREQTPLAFARWLLDLTNRVAK